MTNSTQKRSDKQGVEGTGGINLERFRGWYGENNAHLMYVPSDNEVQTILNNQSIVEGLHNFIDHCDEMIKSYDSQIETCKDSKRSEFLISQSEEWGRKKNDLVELIEFRTINHKEKESQ